MTLDNITEVTKTLVADIQAIVDVAVEANPDMSFHGLSFLRTNNESGLRVAINTGGTSDDGVRVQLAYPIA